MPLPLVKVANKDLKPMSPLEGATKVSLCLPSTSIGFISSNCIITWVFACAELAMLYSARRPDHTGVNLCNTCMQNNVHTRTADDQMTEGCCMR